MAAFARFKPIKYVITLSMSLEQRQIVLQLFVQLTLLICVTAGITSNVFVFVDCCFMYRMLYTEPT